MFYTFTSIFRTADIPVHAALRQVGVPVGAVRSGDINWKNADGWHIATALDIQPHHGTVGGVDAIFPGCRLRTRCNVDGFPLQPDVAISVCGEVTSRDA
ncbi:hypothetical protein PIB30_051630 [Stylosanthes scabra]|uniref:Uncharacterized protein n=1 Tax=Stylosanthes scabra TaxID=79078 RepID=A0ABU6UIR4_9FABA|nr:hypothetical protein [Stylosanthes scabra]